MKSRATMLAILTVTTLASAGCPGPEAGELTVSLVTPNSDDGAIVVQVRASESKEVSSATAACSGCRIFMEQPSATELRAVVTGDLVAGPLVRVSVTDTKSPETYTAQITQVASRTFQLRAATGYSLTIGK